jgi:TolA-binding protein
MNSRTGHNINNQDESVKSMSQNGWNEDLSGSENDSVLYKSFGEYMKGHLDIEEVKNDPELSAAQEKVREMMTDCTSSRKDNDENEKFIRNNFTSDKPGNSANDEIISIRQEIEEKNLDLVTAEWVKEWHEKKQRTGSSDVKTDEIRNFITESLNSNTGEVHVKSESGEKKGNARRLFLRYISVAAAALVSVFLLIRTLLPSSDPEYLFTSYYKPFEAVSPVTRSVNADLNITFSSAVSSYKKGDYLAASAGLEAVLKKEPSSITAIFYMGLSQLAQGNYDNAIKNLVQVAEGSGDYGKEAQWYLGLSYLKKGDKLKAAEYFESLEKSRGYYHDRSEKILRRLK